MGLAMGRADKRGHAFQLVKYVLLLLVVTEIPGTASAAAKQANKTKTKVVTPKLLQTDIDYRLPRSLKPEFYQVELQPDMTNPKNFTFRGKVMIRMKCKEATNTITLHASGLDIIRESINVIQPKDKYHYAGYAEAQKKEFYTIKLDNTLEAGGTYSININFTGELKSEPVGLYYVKYERKGKTRYMVKTKFEPTYARRAFPCFDEPEMKAQFQIDLVKPYGDTSVSNMALKNKENTIVYSGKIYNIDNYRRTPRMPTYLVAFVFYDFEANKLKANQKKKFSLTLWYSRELNKRKSKGTLHVGMTLFAHFRSFFKDIPSKKKITKLHMVAVPGKDCKASHELGVITFRQAYLMDNDSNAAEKHRTYTTLARAFAHQFLGNLVTPAWWDEIWINEGFASFIEQSAVASLNKDVNMDEFFVMDKLHPAFALDGGIYSRPLFTWIQSPHAIKAMFGGIAVYKGAAIFRMMEFFMGEEHFRKAINEYVKKREGKTATRGHLYSCLQKHADKGGHKINVKEILETWVLQTSYPVVMVARDFNKHDHIEVTQERFLDDDAAEDDDKFNSPFNYRWSIPLTFFSSKTIRALHENVPRVYWLHKDEYSKLFKFDSPLSRSDDPDGSWILANYNQMGYYRVNYPTGNWLALAMQLRLDHKIIPVINRAQIINDAWNLAKARYVELETAFAVVEYLQNEEIYLPWLTAMKEFNYVASMVEGTPEEDKFRVYVQSKLIGPYNKLGFKVQDTYVRQLMQSLAVLEGCNFGIKACNNETSTKFKAWMSSEGKHYIAQNVRTAVYCRGIANERKSQQQNHWDFVLEKYTKTDDEEEKEQLLYALSCANEKMYMDLIGDMILKNDSIFPESSAFKILNLMINKLVFKDAGWTFYYENYEQLKDKYESFSCRFALLELTKNFNTNEDLAAVTTFMKFYCENYDEKTYPREIIDNIKKNIEWRNRNLPINEKLLKITQPKPEMIPFVMG